MRFSDVKLVVKELGLNCVTFFDAKWNKTRTLLLMPWESDRLENLLKTNATPEVLHDFVCSII
jgi:hypothetical protein